MFKAEQPLKQDKGITVSSTVAETIIGSETRYKGTVTTSKAIRVDGSFEGETGQFKGTVECLTLFTSGQIEGTITVQGRLECTGTGWIKGDLTVRELILAEGAVFDGTCNMSKFNASKEV
jgi:cytoskeletal protein CcmA (bactofilin family)